MKPAIDSKTERTRIEDLSAEQDVQGGATQLADKSGNTGSGMLFQR